MTRDTEVEEERHGSVKDRDEAIGDGVEIEPVIQLPQPQQVAERLEFVRKQGAKSRPFHAIEAQHPCRQKRQADRQ